MNDQDGDGGRARRRRNVSKIVLFALGALGLVVGGVVACSPASAPKPVSISSAPAANRSTPVSASPTTSEGTLEAVKSWFDNGGQTALDAVASDLTAVQKGWSVASATGNARQAVIACLDLGDAVMQTTSAGPIPYARSEKAFAKALAYWKAAAADCLAASGDSGSLVGKSAREVSLGNTWCLKAFKILDGLIPPPPLAPA